MLPPLKEAGVVDAGGMGVLYILMGAAQALDGTLDMGLIPISEEKITDTSPEIEIGADIRFAYCTEFFIKNLFSHVTEDDIDKLKGRLSNLGDSIVVVGDLDLIKVHVHTNMPGKALQLALRFGELSGIKIDNMKEQHRHVIIEKKQKEYGVVAVAMGDGISSIFKDLAVDYVIEGGQTMNPSIEDIPKASSYFIIDKNR
jgi:dihydroxyacetone kinase-like predicted kinase